MTMVVEVAVTMATVAWVPVTMATVAVTMKTVARLAVTIATVAKVAVTIATVARVAVTVATVAKVALTIATIAIVSKKKHSKKKRYLSNCYCYYGSLNNLLKFLFTFRMDLYRQFHISPHGYLVFQLVSFLIWQ